MYEHSQKCNHENMKAKELEIGELKKNFEADQDHKACNHGKELNSLKTELELKIS